MTLPLLLNADCTKGLLTLALFFLFGSQEINWKLLGSYIGGQS